MTSRSVVLVTLVVYQLALVTIGVVARKRTRDNVDFFLGGRGLGPLLVAVGASASSSSSWSLLGVSGAAWAWGLSAAWLVPACVGGFLLNWLVVAPAVGRAGRRTGAVTLVDLVAGPERPAAVVRTGAVIVMLCLGAYVAAQFQGVGKTLGAVAGLDPWQSVTLGATVVLVYTSAGGLWAVSLTDTVQGLVMAAAAILLPVVALVEVGGPAALWDAMAAVPADGYLSAGGSRAAPAALGFVLGLLGIGLGYPGQPHVVKYFLALRDGPRAVGRARAIAVGWAVVVYCGMVVLGWCGRVLLPGLADREVVFVEATTALLPPVVGGVVLAAVLSAIMSTADSQLLVASSTVGHDLGWARGNDRRAVRRSRLVVVALTAGAAVMALLGAQQIFSRVLFAWSALGAAFGPLLLVRVVARRSVRPGAAFGAVLSGASLAAIASNSGALLGDAAGVAERIVPFAVAGTIAWLGSRPVSPSEGR